MSIKFVTSCSPAQMDEYGHRLRETQHLLPGPLTWYGDDDAPGLKEFKERWGFYRPPNYLFDVVRFSHKVFAVIDALYEHDGYGVWIDADCVVKEALPQRYAETPADSYISLFQRAGMYSECGYYVIDCRHAEHRRFLDTWRSWYTSGSFKTLANWTDCETLDATIRRFERVGLIKARSLSGNYAHHMNPMDYGAISKYVEHRKGARKHRGYEEQV